MDVRPIAPEDRDWILETVSTAFGTARLSNEHVLDESVALDGYAVEHDGRPVGCALLNVEANEAELVALVTTYRGAGAGTALLDAVVARARRERWKRLWLITSNDNVDAIRMYQRLGWDWTEFRRDSITRARASEPGIPERGNHDIPLRHEIMFEAPL